MLATAIRTTTPLSASAPRIRSTSEARLCLAPPESGAGADRLEGAWWPRSRDLRRELPALVALLDPRFGRIALITVDGDLWAEPPRRIAAGADTVDVGWVRTRRSATEVCELSGSAGRWHLLVVPPECEFAESALLMAASGEVGGSGARRWMARGYADRSRAAEQRTREAAWESEGGAVRDARGASPPDCWRAGDVPSPEWGTA